MKILFLGEVGIGETMARIVVQRKWSGRTNKFSYYKRGIEELTNVNLIKN